MGFRVHSLLSSTLVTCSGRHKPCTLWPPVLCCGSHKKGCGLRWAEGRFHFPAMPRMATIVPLCDRAGIQERHRLPAARIVLSSEYIPMPPTTPLCCPLAAHLALSFPGSHKNPQGSRCQRRRRQMVPEPRQGLGMVILWGQGWGGGAGSSVFQSHPVMSVGEELGAGPSMMWMM